MKLHSSSKMMMRFQPRLRKGMSDSFVQDIENYIPKSLNPKDHGSYITFDCKFCCNGSVSSKRQTMFLYKNGRQAFCNRKNHCNWTPYIWELGVRDYKSIKGYDYSKGKMSEAQKVMMKSSATRYSSTPDNFDLEMELAQKKEFYQHRHTKFQKLFSRVDEDVKKYLEYRIPGGYKPYMYGHCGSTRFITGLDDKLIENRWKHGYNLATPLWNIPFGLMTNVQTRFNVPDGIPNFTGKNGKPLKTLSLKLKGGYGPGGATFGCLRNTLLDEAERVRKEGGIPTLIVAEGDVDFLTILGSKLPNVVGIPGCGMAPHIINYLKEIKWRGNLILSLDGDDAGQKSVARALRNYSEEDSFKVFNARFDKYDINDIYNNLGGQEAVRRVMAYARPVVLPVEKRKKKPRPDDMKDLIKAGLYVPMRYMPSQMKERIRLTLKFSEEKNKSPISKLGRVANCSQVRETHMLYYHGNEFPTRGESRSRVAESGACIHCCISQWNSFLAKKLLNDWPEEMYCLTIPFEKGDVEGAKSLKKQILRDCTLPPEMREEYEARGFGKSLCVLIDVMRSHLVVLCGSENQNDTLIQVLRNYQRLEKRPTKDILKYFVMPAYLGYAEYVLESVSDITNNLVEDPILTTRFERYYSREGLKFPSQKEVREGVRAFVAANKEERRLEEEAEEKKRREELGLENAPEPEKNLKYKVVATYRHLGGAFKNMIGLSYQSLSYDNIVRRDIFGLPMNFDPRDNEACNFLENPELSPKPVDELINDFFWIEFGHPVELPKDMKIPGFYGVKVDKIEGNKKDYGDLEKWSEYSAWDTAGWDPNIFTFYPGDMSLREFEHRIEKNQWERHMVKEEYWDDIDPHPLT